MKLLFWAGIGAVLVLILFAVAFTENTYVENHTIGPFAGTVSSTEWVCKGIFGWCPNGPNQENAVVELSNGTLVNTNWDGCSGLNSSLSSTGKPLYAGEPLNMTFYRGPWGDYWNIQYEVVCL